MWDNPFTQAALRRRASTLPNWESVNMRVFHPRFLTAALAVVALLGVVSTADAQGFARRGIVPIPINTSPSLSMAPQTLGQYAFNTALLGRAYSQVPPYVLGYNPYPQVINSGLNVNAGYPGGGYGGYPGFGSNYLAGGAGGYVPGGATLSTTGYGGGGASLDSSYYPPNPYVPSYDPYGGALTGVANVINANGKYLIDVQNARKKMNEADLGKLEVNRRIWEEAEWERKHTPRSEDVRLFEMKEALSRSLLNPPDNELFDGRALNAIYQNVKDRQGAILTAGGKLPNVPVETDMLQRINLTTGGTNGNVGLLKNELERNKSFSWPLPLMDDVFKTEREDLTKKMSYALEQIKNEKTHTVGAATLNDIKADLDALHRRVADRNTRDMTPSESIEARRYLTQLDAAFRALQDPKVANYFDDAWKLKGKSVSEIVDEMTRKGIKFAPGTQGTEDAYRMMHSALVAYYSGLPQTASTAPR
jgi:hypothetical protein